MRDYPTDKRPDPIRDILVIGGGPAGAGAAIRAQELGLSVTLVDRDQVLSVFRRLRTPRQNSVDSVYGAFDDRIPFPKGGPKVNSLAFHGRVGLESILETWTRALESIDHRGATELIELDQQAKGMWAATCLSRDGRVREVLSARNIVLAVGRGPSIEPGLGGGEQRLFPLGDDIRPYVGRPACVLGTGPRSFEAISKISMAKVEADDNSDVYWSFPGDELPRLGFDWNQRVDRVISENQNVHLLPQSFALFLGSADDGQEILAIRSKFHPEEEAPNRGEFLEFPLARVASCADPEFPDGLLDQLGIERWAYQEGDDASRGFPVTPSLESARRGLFLAGDLLAPGYLRTLDFAREKAYPTFVDHRPHIRRALYDGVLVCEAIAKRLQGWEDAKVFEFLDALRLGYESSVDDGAPASGDGLKERSVHSSPSSSSRSRLDHTTWRRPDPRPQSGAQFSLQSPNGEWLPLKEQAMGQAIALIDLAPSEASLQGSATRLLIEEGYCAIQSGVDRLDTYLSLRLEKALSVGERLLVGKSSLVVERTGEDFFLVIHSFDGDEVGRLSVDVEERYYGRDSIDPGDRRLSRRHFSVMAQGPKVQVRDAGSTNGTFLLVDGTQRLHSGDEFAVGKARFRYEGASSGSSDAESKHQDLREIPSAPSLAIRVEPMGIKVEVPEGTQQTILDALMAEGMASSDPGEIKGACQNFWECGIGRCGLCVVDVRQGSENLSPPGFEERRTLQSLASREGMDVARCRLSCVAQVKGPIAIQMLGLMEEDK